MERPQKLSYNGVMRLLLIAIAHGLLSLCVQAQWINQPTPGIPRTPEGKVDLAAPPPKMANDKPDFSGMTIPEAGAVARPDIAVAPHATSDIAYSLIRVLDKSGKAVGF